MDKKVFTLRDSAIRDRMKCFADGIQIDPEKPIDVIFQPHKKNRSLAQNNLLWMWLGRMANFLREEHGLKTNSDDLKDYFQREYLGHKDYEVPSEDALVTRLIGTSELNAAQFTEFLNRIDVYAGAELGLKLPHPEDLYYEAMAMGARR